MGRRLRTEGGWRFILGLSALFTCAGAAFLWQGLTGHAGSWTPAVALLAAAAIVLAWGREDILAARDVWREGVEVTATVSGIRRSPTMNVNRTRFLWRVQASGRLPDGEATEFLSPSIIAARQPEVQIGSPVTVRVSPLTHRYRMDLGSLVFTDPERLEAPGWSRAVGDGVRRRWPLLLAVLVVVVWILSMQLDRGALGYGWLVIPLVLALLVADLVTIYRPLFIQVAALIGLFRRLEGDARSRPPPPDR